MLSCDEMAQLASAVCATAESLGQAISANAARLIASDLAEHEPAVIQAALRACRRELTGRLTLATILGRIQAVDGRPGKDEAWSIALAASDEHETVVLTAEIRQAMTAATPILKVGDRVGARMAFISAYERLVTGARAEGLPVQWEVSLGHDAGRRVPAIESAVRSQLITREAGARYVADLRIAPVTVDGKALASLLTGEVHDPATPNVRKKLAEVRSIIDASKARQAREKIKKAQAERVDTYLRKRKARAALAAFAKEQS